MLCRLTLSVLIVYFTLEFTDAKINSATYGSYGLNVTNGSCMYYINVQSKFNLSQANDTCRDSEAILEKCGRLFNKEVTENITVENVQGVEKFTANACGTNVNISYTPHIGSLGQEHKIEILNEDVYTSEYPQSATPRELQFGSLRENSRLTAKITVCPSCHHAPSNKTSFNTTMTHPAQVIRHFYIFKEYQSNDCRLIWYNGFLVTDYELITTYHDIVQSDSRQPPSQNSTRFTSNQTQCLVPMEDGKNYTFALSAKTCGGFSQSVLSVGQCIFEEGEKPAANSTRIMPSVFGALFGLSMFMNAIIIFLCIRRKRQTQGGRKQDCITRFKSETQPTPYQITHFEDTATSQDTYNDGASGNSSHDRVLKQDRPTYENTKSTTYENGTKIPSHDYVNTMPPSLSTVDRSTSEGDGYLTAITHTNEMIKEDVYQYENLSKSTNRTEGEYPEWDDDSFDSQDTNDATVSATHSNLASVLAAMKKSRGPLPNLTTNLHNLAHQKTESVVTPALAVKGGFALKPPISAKAFSSNNQDKGLVKMPMQPPVVNLLPGSASKLQTKDQNFKFPLKPLKTLPHKNLNTASNTQGHSEIAMVLARLKQTGVRK